MATSGALSTDNSHIKYKISITQNSQDTVNNTSNVTVKVSVYRTNTGYTTSGSGTVYCKINGTRYSASITTSQKITNTSIVIFTKTLNIPHNSDGTKTLSTSAWITHSQFKSSEQSYSQSLTTIPRATTPILSKTTADMGTPITITMNRASSSFTHNLSFFVGSTEVEIGSGYGTSLNWTIPLGLVSNAPNSTSLTIVIRCITYNGSTKIGTKDAQFTATVPTNIVPKVNNLTLTSISDNEIINSWGVNVQGYTRMKLVCDASGVSRSTINAYKFSGQYSVTQTSNEYIGGIINGYGNLKFRCSVVDSRARESETFEKVVKFYEYSPPVIDNLFIERSTSNSLKMKVHINYSFSSVGNKNQAEALLYYRANNSPNWILYNGTIPNNTETILPMDFNEATGYAFVVVIRDSLGNETVQETAVSTAKVLLDFKAGGDGLGIGKIAESASLEIALDTKFIGSTIYIDGVELSQYIRNIIAGG